VGRLCRMGRFKKRSKSRPKAKAVACNDAARTSVCKKKAKLSDSMLDQHNREPSGKC
jgi:hypothetical protein